MDWSLAHAKLHALLRQRILLPKKSRVLMAVSGGQDSLCLARLLIDLQPQWDWSLGLVHCDHRWREDSAQNASYVLTLANTWQIPAWIEVAQTVVTSEAEARQWRYETFAQVARAQGYSHVVTGHTASDRAETALYNLIRGTGIDGLSALAWQRALDSHQPAIELVRPLLNFSRQETKDICCAMKISVWEDSSNLDVSFRRNRIRQELLPYLQEHFNPQVERAIAQTAEITAADIDYLQAQTNQLYAQVVTEITTTHSLESNLRTERSWEIDAPTLNLAPLALQRRVIRQILQTGLPKPPNFQQIESLTALLKAPNGSRTSTYPGGLVAQVRKPIVWIGVPP